MALCDDLEWWGGDRETQEGRGVCIYIHHYIYHIIYLLYTYYNMIYIMMNIYIYNYD